MQALCHRSSFRGEQRNLPRDPRAESYRHLCDVSAGSHSHGRGWDRKHRQRGVYLWRGCRRRAGAHASYSASKAAIVGLTRELAAQWGARGVRVNALAPAYFHTPMTEGAFRDSRFIRRVRRRTLLGRPGEPHELDGPPAVPSVRRLILCNRARAGRRWWLDGDIDATATFEDGEAWCYLRRWGMSESELGVVVGGARTPSKVMGSRSRARLHTCSVLLR